MSKEDKHRLDNLVYNGLDSNDTDKALSAKQGKILSDRLEELKESYEKTEKLIQDQQSMILCRQKVDDLVAIVSPVEKLSKLEDRLYGAAKIKAMER